MGVFIGNVRVANVAALNFDSVAPGSPAEGDLWRDSSRKIMALRETGLVGCIPMTFFVQTADASLTNTTSEGSIIGAGLGSLTLPANFICAGRTVRLRMLGTIATLVTPTIRIRAKLGSTVIVDTTALALLAITGTDQCIIEVDFTCRSAGASGSIFAHGAFAYHTTASTLNRIQGVNTAPITIDTTVAQAIDITAQWGTASTLNVLTTHEFWAEAVC